MKVICNAILFCPLKDCRHKHPHKRSKPTNAKPTTRTCDKQRCSYLDVFQKQIYKMTKNMGMCNIEVRDESKPPTETMEDQDTSPKA